MINDFLERDLEDIVYENKGKIHERGFPFLLDNTIRQFYLPSGKKIDLFSYSILEDSISCKIFELKRECLMPPHITQVLDYSTEVYYHLYPGYKNISVERYIIGNDLSEATKSLIEDIINLDVYLYKFGFNGLFFKKWQTKFEIGEEILDRILTQNEHSEKFKFRLEEINKNRQSK